MQQHKHTACVKRELDWLDKNTPWDLISAVLRWVDTAQTDWYHLESSPPSAKALLAAGFDSSSQNHAVTRAHRLQLFVPESHEWPDRVSIYSWLSRVGSSSWDMSYDVVAPGGHKLTSIVTTLVMVDETLLKTKPIPNREELVQFTQSPSTSLRPYQCGIKDDSKTLQCYRWRGTVRQVDCDSLGHINNGKYPALAIQALYDAIAVGAVPGNPNAKSLLSTIGSMYISYIGQLYPRDEYSVEIWMLKTDTETVFQCEFVGEEKPMCTVVIDCISSRRAVL